MGAAPWCSLDFLNYIVIMMTSFIMLDVSTIISKYITLDVINIMTNYIALHVITVKAN